MFVNFAFLNKYDIGLLQKVEWIFPINGNREGSSMVNTFFGVHTYFSYLRLICSDNLTWLKSGNHACIKQAQYIWMNMFTI